MVPPGIYNTTTTIFVPSYTTIIGAGSDKTIINYTPVQSSFIGSTVSTSITVNSANATSSMVGSSIAGTGIPDDTTVVSANVGVSITISRAATSTNSATFTLTPSGAAIQFVNDDSTIGNPSPLSTTYDATKQPRRIQISGLSVVTNTGKNTCLQLDAVRESLFEDVKLQGSVEFTTYSALSCGIKMNAASSLITTENNIFRNVSCSGFSYSVGATDDTLNNAFEDCIFADGRQGIALGVGADGVAIGKLYGPRKTYINNCKFINIKWHGVYQLAVRGIR
jgi:hypothetical protein